VHCFERNRKYFHDILLGKGPFIYYVGTCKGGGHRETCELTSPSVEGGG